MNIYVCFILSSLPKSSFVSVVFDFSDSLNDVAPVSPILLSVAVMIKEKNGCLLCRLFVSTTQIESNECCV